MVTSTANWRGYVGTWEIRDSRLYLIDLQGPLADGSPLTLDTVFPGFPNRVFAHWYCGRIRAPKGKLLEYVHAGYGSTYEQDILFAVEYGVIVNVEIKDN